MTTQPFEQTLIVEPPDISLINIEDDEPVDNIISAKQQRLLVESLYASWHPNVKFIADANVGIFASPYRPAIVPDVFISMDATLPADMQQKRNRTYFIWEYGKSPEVAIEIISNKKGGEKERKLGQYARLGVTYYVIFDPFGVLLDTPFEVYELAGNVYRLKSDHFLDYLGLGLTIWQGLYEDYAYPWLRWVDAEGNLLLTGMEHAKVEQEKAAKLRAKLRELGIDPDQ